MIPEQQPTEPGNSGLAPKASSPPVAGSDLACGEPTPTGQSGSSELLRPGTQLNGIFEIDAHLASGGMGEVYKGHSIQTGDVVAIKVIRADLTGNELALSMFRKEAAALFQLNHEAIVRYFIFSVDALANRAYLAMEFVEGELISKLFEKGPMTVKEVCRLAERIALGLHAAHAEGIVHGDVAPDNIIVHNGDVGKAKLIDFGIARSLKSGHKTVVDVGFAGKCGYVSPEQLFLFGGEISPKSDIYSLGLVLLEALAGCKTDMGDKPGAAVEKRQRIPDLGSADARIRPLLEKMLEPNPAKRPASMLEVVDYIRNLPAPPKTSANLHIAGAIAALALIGVGAGAGAYLWFHAAPAIAPQSTATPVPNLTPAPAIAAPALPPQAMIEPSPREEKPPSDVPQAKPYTPPASARDRALQFIENYATAPCVSLTALSVTDKSAVIEGIGVSRGPFERFDDSFKIGNGFEAEIHARFITPAQCAALDFFNRFKAEATLSPHIELAASALHNEQVLTGSLSNAGSRKAIMLLVADDGIVRNVSDAIPENGNTFSIPAPRPKGSHQPGLLMAVSTSSPLSALEPANPLKAEAFFSAVQSEASDKKAQLAVSTTYFKW